MDIRLWRMHFSTAKNGGFGAERGRVRHFVRQHSRGRKNKPNFIECYSSNVHEYKRIQIEQFELFKIIGCACFYRVFEFIIVAI